jgi:hypothetical protein
VDAVCLSAAARLLILQTLQRSLHRRPRASRTMIPVAGGANIALSYARLEERRLEANIGR